MTGFGKGTIPNAAEIEKSLTDALRAAALAADWPANIVLQLSVVVTESAISISYPESITKEVEDLEYGTISTPAASVFRKFFNNNSGAVEDSLAQMAVSYLDDNGGLL
jgi:hypothetical protein